jgi:hypothetical protein
MRSARLSFERHKFGGMSFPHLLLFVIPICLAVVLALCFVLRTGSASPFADEILGQYFWKKVYVPRPLPQFDRAREELPRPIDDAHPEWVRVYWKAWQLAFHHFRAPETGSGFVSQFVDPAFSENTYLWDTCFISMFCNYAYPLTPGISSLDNFYAKQHKDGEICREINRSTGVEFSPWVDHKDRPFFSRWGWPTTLLGITPMKAMPVQYVGRRPPWANPRLTLDALDHPIAAWAELEHYEITGDRSRLGQVWEPLVRYYAALRKYLRQGNGLYVTDWASMDNSPRNFYLRNGGTGIDISAEMVLFGRELAEIGSILGRERDASEYSRQAAELARIINERMWDPASKFYFDLTVIGKRAPIMTIAAYWTLLAKVASRSQAADLAAQLRNPKTFGRRDLVPTLSANQPGYSPHGGYWRGSVWAPTDTMVIRGLENYGYNDQARLIALNHLRLVAEVFKRTGTIWENYAPDAPQPGHPAKSNFVGWSGIGPIMYLLDYGIGVRAHAPENRLVWNLVPDGGRLGCVHYRFNGHIVSLLARPDEKSRKSERLSVTSDGPFELEVHFLDTKKVFSVVKGTQELEVTQGH